MYFHFNLYFFKKIAIIVPDLCVSFNYFKITKISTFESEKNISPSIVEPIYSAHLANELRGQQIKNESQKGHIMQPYSTVKVWGPMANK